MDDQQTTPQTPEEKAAAHLKVAERLLTIIYKAKETRKDDKGALMVELLRDGNYSSLHTQSLTVNEAKQKAKLNVLSSNQDAATIADRIALVTEEINDNEASMHLHLGEYYRLTGNRNVLGNGFEFSIKPRFKLNVKQLNLFSTDFELQAPMFPPTEGVTFGKVTVKAE